MKASKIAAILLSVSSLIIIIAVINIYQHYTAHITTINEDQDIPESSEIMTLPLQFHIETFTNAPLELQTQEGDLKTLATYNIGNISQTLYIDNEDQEFPTHSYITVNQTNYYLGKTLEHYDQSSHIAFRLSPVALDDMLEIYEWKEIIGANYIRTMFLTIDNDVPVVIAEITGWAFHEDIDNNGELETVATVGTTPDTTVYLWNFDEKQLQTANVNENTHSEAVTFDTKKHIFTLYNKGTQSTCKYQNGLLYRIQ